MTEKPKMGQIIQDDEGTSWEVTDNANSDKFLYQTQNIWTTIKQTLGIDMQDNWVPVKKVVKSSKGEENG